MNTTSLLTRVNALVEEPLTARDLGIMLARMGSPRMWSGLAEAVAYNWNAMLPAEVSL